MVGARLPFISSFNVTSMSVRSHPTAMDIQESDWASSHSEVLTSKPEDECYRVSSLIITRIRHLE
jgi:hypothetical protein